MDTRDIDDEGEYWERWIIEEICGIDFGTYRSNPEVLTMMILESHLEKILSEIDNFKKGIRSAEIEYATVALCYQVLGLLILETGSFLPSVVKEEVLRSTTWEYDKRWGWGSDLIDSRRLFLKKFRRAMEQYIPGNRYNIYDH